MPLIKILGNPSRVSRYIPPKAQLGFFHFKTLKVMATHGMKVSKSTEKEIDRIIDLLNELNNLKDDLIHKELENVDQSDYEILHIKNKDNDEVIEHILRTIDGVQLRKALFNLSTLLENCADPDCSTLEFNKDISRGLELLELEKQGKLIITI